MSNLRYTIQKEIPVAFHNQFYNQRASRRI